MSDLGQSSPCEKWRDQLLDISLGRPAPEELNEHLLLCAACREELAGLRERAQEMDSSLRTLVRTAGPSPAFHGRLMDAVEAERGFGNGWRFPEGIVAAGAAVAVLGIILALAVSRRESPAGFGALPTAQIISEWRSPTGVLLRTPADELLNSSPRFGELYFPMTSGGSGTDRKPQRRNR